MARHKSLRDLLWRIPVEQEVDGEIAAHLEMQTRRYVEAGMEPAAAREEALRRFGDPERVRRECRAIGREMEGEMHRAELRHELGQDVRFSLRRCASPDGGSSSHPQSLTVSSCATKLRASIA